MNLKNKPAKEKQVRTHDPIPEEERIKNNKLFDCPDWLPEFKRGGEKEVVDLNMEEISMLGQMSAIGLPYKYMAAMLNTSLRSFERYIAKNPEVNNYLVSCHAKPVGDVAKTAYAMAVSGKYPALTIFYLKARGDWHDKQVIEHKGSIDLESIIAPTFEREVVADIIGSNKVSVPMVEESHTEDDTKDDPGG